MKWLNFLILALFMIVAVHADNTTNDFVAANIVNSTNTSVTVHAQSNETVDFDIFYGKSTDNLNSDVFALDTTDTYTVLDNLEPATLYYYYAKACDASDNCNQTEVATFTTAPPVIMFNITNITNSSVTLSASADMLVDFDIFYGINNTENSVQAGFDTQNTDFTLAELQANTTYNITVQGCSAGNVCAFADTISFTTLANALSNDTNTENIINDTNDTNITTTNTTNDAGNQTNDTTETNETGTDDGTQTASTIQSLRGRRVAFVPPPTTTSPPAATPEPTPELTAENETSLAGTQPIVDTTPNTITGAAIGKPSSSSPIWLLTIVAVVIVGFAYVVVRRNS